MRPADAIPDAPVYTATMAEMENLEELLATANQLAMQYGAVRIDPPAEWTHPPLRMNPKSRFFVRIQTLPEAPFVDPEFVKQANTTKRHPRKRTRRKKSTANDEDSEEPALVTKDTKNPSRDRATRASSRSQRYQHQTQADGISPADYRAPANSSAERALNTSLELPPNSTCARTTLPAPGVHTSGPKANEKRSPLPFAMGQTFAAPAFSRAPASRIQPSSSAPGQTEAVREAALRFAEAFSGFAKAGPAPNATAIPPCPFSQHTAREHMAKLTAEDHSPFPLPEGLSLPQALPPAVNGRDLHPNRNQSHVTSGGESQERIMRQGEVPQTYGHASADRRAAEIGQERNSQDNYLQQIYAPVRTHQEEANPDQRVSASIYAWAEMLKRNAEILKAKNHGSEGRAKDLQAQKDQIIATSSSPSAGSQPQALLVVGTGLQQTNSSSVHPVIAKSAEPSSAKGYPEKSLKDAKRTVPFLLCQGKEPVSHESGQIGKSEGMFDVNRNPKALPAPTTWRSPARELDCRNAASTERNPPVRPFLRSVLPPARAPFECQRNAGRMESFIQSSAISSGVPNPARSQGGEGARRPDMTVADATPWYAPPAPLFLQPNKSAFAKRTSPMRPNCEAKAPSHEKQKYMSLEQPWQSEHAHVLRQRGGGAKVEPVSYAPTQGCEELQNTADEKRSTVNYPNPNQLSTDTGAGGKAFHGLQQRNSEVHHAKKPYPTRGSENSPNGSKRGFSHAFNAAPTQGAKREHTISRIGVPIFLNASPNRGRTALVSSQDAEIGLAKHTKLSPAEPMPMPNRKEPSWNPLCCESRGLPREKLETAIDPGREIVEEMLALATRGADLISVKVQSKVLRTEIPTDDIMTHPACKQPSLIHEESRSRRGDTMQIDTILNNTVSGRLERGEEVQKRLTEPEASKKRRQEPERKQAADASNAKVPHCSLIRNALQKQIPISNQTAREEQNIPTAPEATTKRKQEAEDTEPADASNFEVPHCSPVRNASQERLPSCGQPLMDVMQDKSKCGKQHADDSPAQRLSQPALLRERQFLHPTQPKESAVTSEEVVLVAENRTALTREHKPVKPGPIMNVDATDVPVPESKDMSSHAKPQAKRGPKRKLEKFCPHFDQDDVGRLTKAIVFPDSGTPVSLADYEKKAYAHHEETKRALDPFAEGGPETTKTQDLISMIDMHDVDTLEIEFWNAMTGGIGGKSITVAYGVDVEAEGAFDSTEMSYVEWYGGADPTRTKPNKRKKGRPPKQKGLKTARRPRASENVLGKSMSPIDGSCADDLHHDADDEMECDIDDALRTLAARRQMGHIENTNLSPAGSVNQRNIPKGPRNHVGTLNRHGLLRHLPRMPGINHSMYYVGQLFTRFCWHTEDAYLNSVSYLHHGSAEKVWYAVPPRDAAKFERYAASNVFSPEILEDASAGQTLLMNKTTMFDPRRVRRKGVAVFRVVHKPGSFVLTAARAYHAGFNCGFNIAEAVNFANPTWFPVGREASCFARQTLKPLCVPWEYLLFHEAKAMRDLDRGAIERTISTQRLIGNARTVAKELRAIIMDGEMKIRRHAEASNCRVSMLHQIDGLAKNNQVGPEFGHGAGLVCSLCTHTCHFYAEMCGSCDDSFEARCVDHFGQGHRMCSERGHKTVIVRRHDPVLLLDILGHLEQIAGIEIDPAEQSRRYVGYLRTWQTPLKSSGLRLRLDLKAAVSRLPPKVSKEKSVREKSVREKNVRGKTNRDKPRKIRKPRGMFPPAEVKSKRRTFPRVKVLEEVEVISSAGVQHEKGAEGECNFDEVVELANEIPFLR